MGNHLFHPLLEGLATKTVKFKQDVYVQGKYVGSLEPPGKTRGPLTNSGVCAIVTAQWLAQRLAKINYGFARSADVPAREDSDMKTKVDLAQMTQLFFKDDTQAVAGQGLQRWADPRIALLKEHGLIVQNNGYLCPDPFLKRIKALIGSMADDEGVFLSNTMIPAGENPQIKPSHATGMCRQQGKFEYFDANYGAHAITPGSEMDFFTKYVEIYQKEFKLTFTLTHDFVVWAEGATE